MQASLFGFEAPSFDRAFRRANRVQLRTDAWLEHATGWLSGHERLFQDLLVGVDWQHQRRQMYDREVEVPRLVGHAPSVGDSARLLGEVAAILSLRYELPLESISLAYYRDGRDSVAPHGDKMGPLRSNTVIAILSLGEPRRFTLRAVDGGSNFVFSLGWGDLLVMGGSCQETFLHGIPKVKRAGPRMSIQFRQVLPPSLHKAYRDDVTASVPVRVTGVGGSVSVSKPAPA